MSAKSKTTAAAKKRPAKKASGLAKKKCVPCDGNVPKLTKKEIAKLMPQIEGWEVRDDKLHKHRTFFDFVEAIDFVNAMAEVAEDEGHHPDFCVHFNEVDVTIWTHAIDGLSENDFILAAKIDELG
jgi:4a-hydroxytetrahydrobiopterin dehydratase